ncbi:MAG: membrane protein [Pirellulaceae bacterium]|uniref:DUF1385 domain-containing protein n=1 Tax=Litorilinea aerophila TaxID=1204385 RepID=A0A540VJK5_9CHLR|nr:DUF1385 domain-containing protein [Litorilinea aerophila]MCC9075429.1 DUF1385 domain-containing protein [Litorilinea aerophila]GIV80478.1 MAG: membrane protein [Litorilinea sp.]GIW90748.1 MAG: membrane protein [Pirellulaceae bacterium]
MSRHYYGGQAVLEGVMMRGRKAMAVAVRTPQGHIVVHEEPLTAKIYTSTWGKWPFVRGIAMLWDALGLGMRALLWSAEVASQEEGEEPVEFSGPVAWTTIAASLAVAIVLFFLIPTWISRWLASLLNDHPMVDALLEGGIRLLLFLIYLYAIGRLPDIQRVFGYHGAEHKTINAYEAGAALTVDQVRPFSVQHTRCGTSFLLYVLVISIFLFAPLTFAGVQPGWLALVLRFVTRLLLVPVVASIAYEIIRFSAAHDDKPLMRALIAPGLALQKMTTREPDDAMIECAIAALQPVLAADGVISQAIAPGEPQGSPVTSGGVHPPATPTETPHSPPGMARPSSAD